MSTADGKALKPNFDKSALVLTCTELPAELCDSDLAALEPADKDILEAATADFLQLRDLLWRNLAVIQSQALEIELKFGLCLLVVASERRRARFVKMDTV